MRAFSQLKTGRHAVSASSQVYEALLLNHVSMKYPSDTI